ncbi:MAG TPA: hypothetical protein VNM66_01545 [Thermodesulfobacteriota bacterium]|nr:hypothetical protein [Thermodesulfobacteriota bacterium]
MTHESVLADFFPRLSLPATPVPAVTHGDCWTFNVGPCPVYVYHFGSTLLLSASLGTAPTVGTEGFYRRLLALNAEADLLGARLGVEPTGAIKLTQVALLGSRPLEFETFRANLEGFMRGMRVAGESIVAGLAEVRAGLAAAEDDPDEDEPA